MTELSFGTVLVLLTGVVLALAVYVHSRSGIQLRVRTDGGYLSGLDAGTAKPANVLIRWLTTIDHRDIGILYLVFGTVAALWGATDAMMMRTELLTPAATIWDAETYNALFTVHALTMLFFFVTPVFTGIGNYFLPLLLGADDMAFPRVNAIAFWLLPPSLLLVRGGLITELVGKALELVGVVVPALFKLQPPTTGWTMYTPMSAQLLNPQVDLVLLGLHLGGIATTLAALNFIVTIFLERSEDVTWARLDIFSWALLTTSGITLFAFPMLGSALVMLLLDRNFGTVFYAVEGGGPLLWQHLFWFFGHPEVYLIVLPSFGLMSLILPKFTGRRLFGFKFIIYSTLAIGVLSFGVWAHHMFTTGLDPRLGASFMTVTLAIAVPSAVKVFNWITTMWYADIRLTAPMLFCLGGIATFIVGGITGVFLAAIPVDTLLHGTYYVVGHFHLIIMGIIPFTMFAASYYWFPLLTGRMYNQRLARVQAVTVTLGTFLTFVPMLVIGYIGIPRRYAAYPEGLLPLQQLSSVGAFIIAIAVVMWVINMIQSVRVGTPVDEADVWNLKETGQFTREWQWFEGRLDGDTARGDQPSGAGD